jgi:hypothetical protein
MVRNYKRIAEKAKWSKEAMGRCCSMCPKWRIYKKLVEEERHSFYSPSRTSKGRNS